MDGDIKGVGVGLSKEQRGGAEDGEESASECMVALWREIVSGDVAGAAVDNDSGADGFVDGHFARRDLRMTGF